MTRPESSSWKASRYGCRSQTSTAGSNSRSTRRGEPMPELVFHRTGPPTPVRRVCMYCGRPATYRREWRVTNPALDPRTPLVPDHTVVVVTACPRHRHYAHLFVWLAV